MIDVKDRVSTYPGRIKLTKPDGTFEYYTLERADVPTQEGTPINRVLFESIKADLDTKVSKLGDNINGPLTLQGDVPTLEFFDGPANTWGKVYKDANANADYGMCVADFDQNSKKDVLNLRRANALASKLSLLVENTNGTTSTYSVYGTHNKTWGSYTGNGTATVRQVNTSGLGFACIVRSSNGTSIVFGSGVMRAAGSTFTWLPSGQSYFRNGILYIATTDSALNTSGVTYTYEVL
jgi:hypothetical protein